MKRKNFFKALAGIVAGGAVVPAALAEAKKDGRLIRPEYEGISIDPFADHPVPPPGYIKVLRSNPVFPEKGRRVELAIRCNPDDIQLGSIITIFRKGEPKKMSGGIPLPKATYYTTYGSIISINRLGNRFDADALVEIEPLSASKRFYVIKNETLKVYPPRRIIDVGFQKTQ